MPSLNQHIQKLTQLNRYKLCLCLITCILFSTSTFAQDGPKGDGKVKGVVIDATTSQPVSYASVSLAQSADNKEVNGATTDDKGQFTITDVADGNYKILVYFVGYVTDTIPNVVISKSNRSITIPAIKLKNTSANLKAVEVTAQKSVIENKIDKMVYNVENDLTAQTGVATDALKKIPMVDVDVDGNVELQGSGNIRFLINGKPSTVFGNNIADVLQAIPASQIQSIEVITSPGAKYDAEGTGGIINIILKKSTAQGINGSVSLTGGTRLENGSLNLNARKGNFGAHAFFSPNGQLQSTTLTNSNRTGLDSNSKTILLQNGSTDFTRLGYQSGAGLDWEFIPKNTISASFSYFYYGYNSTGTSNRENIAEDMYGNKLSDSLNLLNNGSNFHSHSLDYNVDYKKEFAKDGEELDISYNGSMDNNFSYYTQSQEDVPSEYITAGSYGNNPNVSHESTASIDYTLPINDSLKFEMGAKADFNTINSTSDVYLLDPSSDEYGYSTTESNAFTYQNSIYAAYILSDFRLFHWLDVKAGFRDEYTVSMANFSQVGNVNVPSYNTPVPSLTLSHKLKGNQMLKISYSHRIERPDAWDLNPFINATDPQNVTTGNPYLAPEIGNKVELGYNKTFDKKGGNIFFTLFYRGSTQDIQTYTYYYPTFKIGDSTYNNVAVTERANIGSENNYGASIYGSVSLTPELNIRCNLSGFERYIVTGLPDGGNVHGFNYRTNMNVTYDITKTLTVEAFGNFNSPRVNAQGTVPSFTTYSLAIRKQFWNKKASIAITAVNAFSKYVNQPTNLVGDNFTLISTREVPYQSFGINLTYKFGKLEFKDDKQPDDPNMGQPQGGN